MKGGNIRYGDSVAMRAVNLTFSGDEKNHKLVLVSQGEPAAANLQITGNFDRTSQKWQGSLSQVKIDTPIGEVKSNQSIPVTYDNKKHKSQLEHIVG
ncbi:Uncharacterised protein [Rodentibacter pneumotropicus]|uniref:Uncharacterized protein n=1 Tax=Rodentibacter pneumotropicus TaxID=758 RepID=A0A448MJ62_9PAST|nr:Uncharacterised protein [Rodentibacter pneumotropicus]